MAARAGYRLAGTAAGKAVTQNSGGALALCRKHLAAWPRERAPLLCDGLTKPTQAHGHDWLALQIILRSTAVTVYMAA